jgi:hypothetical protein
MGNKSDAIEGATKAARKPAVRRTAAPKTATATNGNGTPAVRKTAPKAAKPQAGTTPSQQDIALRAYLIGERRRKAGEPGDSLSDWLQAERELRA